MEQSVVIKSIGDTVKGRSPCEDNLSLINDIAIPIKFRSGQK